MSSFGHYARKARNPNLDIWIRWSALHSCLSRYCELTHQPFAATRKLLILPLPVGPGRPPTEQEMWSVVGTLEAERNIFLERLRAFHRRRIRAKARGYLSPSASEWEALYRPVILASEAGERAS